MPRKKAPSLVQRIKVRDVADLLAIHPNTLDRHLANDLFTVLRDGLGTRCHRYCYTDEVQIYLEQLVAGPNAAIAAVRWECTISVRISFPPLQSSRLASG